MAPFVNSLVTPSLSCVHKHLLSFDWERQPCQSKYLDTVSVCLCVPVILWSLQFLVRVFTFLSLNLWFTYFGTFLSTWPVLEWNKCRGALHSEMFYWQKAAEGSNEEKLSVYLDICKNCHPVFRYFFTENFPTPGVWYERRLAYIHR